MLEEAHKGLEAISTAANAVKDEEWGQAERALMEVQEITGRLLREVGDKAREKMMAPAPERRRPGLSSPPRCMRPSRARQPELPGNAAQELRRVPMRSGGGAPRM